IVGPFDVSQVNFDYISKLTNINLGFDVLNPSTTEWEEFQKKWKESTNLFFSPEPKPNTPAPIEEASDKREDAEGTTN
ncbi:hypothetical protein J1N35_028937, partial [Gossypium stocksii]